MTDIKKLMVRCVRPDSEIMTKQRLPYFVGVSKDTVGAQGISMNLVVIPPGVSPAPHYHNNFETAIYILKGEVKTSFGIDLKETIINREGDFVLYGSYYYEIVKLTEPRKLFGQVDYDFELSARCRRARKGLFDAT